MVVAFVLQQMSCSVRLSHGSPRRPRTFGDFLEDLHQVVFKHLVLLHLSPQLPLPAGQTQERGLEAPGLRGPLPGPPPPRGSPAGPCTELATSWPRTLQSHLTAEQTGPQTGHGEQRRGAGRGAASFWCPSWRRSGGGQGPPRRQTVPLSGEPWPGAPPLCAWVTLGDGVGEKPPDPARTTWGGGWPPAPRVDLGGILSKQCPAGAYLGPWRPALEGREQGRASPSASPTGAVVASQSGPRDQASPSASLGLFSYLYKPRGTRGSGVFPSTPSLACRARPSGPVPCHLLGLSQPPPLKAPEWRGEDPGSPLGAGTTSQTGLLGVRLAGALGWPPQPPLHEEDTQPRGQGLARI